MSDHLHGVQLQGRSLLVALVSAAALCAGCGGRTQEPDQGTAHSHAAVAPQASTPSLAVPATNVPTTAPNAATVGKPGHPRGGTPAGVDTTSPDSVAAAVAQAVCTWDTAIDKTPQDAARRAADWMTPQEAERSRTALTSGGGTYWTQLSRTDGWTSAAVTQDTEPPPPTAGDSTGRRVFVTVSAHASSGSAPGDQRWTVVVALSRDGSGRWRASQVLMRPTDGSG